VETIMNFEYSDKTKDMVARVRAFMDRHVYPNQERFDRELNEGGNRWKVIPVLEELKPLARKEGLWNMFVPPSHGGTPVNEYRFEGTPLTNLEYAPLAEEMGRVGWASEVFNCSAPDTGNMEVLARYGTAEQQQQWLVPLSNGAIRAARWRSSWARPTGRRPGTCSRARSWFRWMRRASRSCACFRSSATTTRRTVMPRSS
jgi:alkylation response protein AidB-like acyl-CoA dehydrogenase